MDNKKILDGFFDLETIKSSVSKSMTRYSQGHSPVQYTPTGITPTYTEMIDESKYNQLIEDIEKANISDKDKYFLKMCATRHLKFTYSKIADYYANASKEVQQLMEDSALVIIDYDDAIYKGYITLSKRTDELAKLDLMRNLEEREEAAKNGRKYKE